ncbi:RdgB/HAM1 family non-canonical purine NTP pyrophosphatase [Salinivibrio kushneri]|uniref:dITP/XTP pyrophosphatase n=1 Tax=Salinivibrio kushneri TaxID=1908198 RepID=A0AA47KJW0_9GAMM|nr:RdgB/HAM1 family non-canonical purine NTP pyrophosphatase [Salinivibrio kushneri]WBA08315.1 RdgB/HAM1 family non-canonical purine NTP pyrophosphatase [Salinivibrio kushneri]
MNKVVLATGNAGKVKEMAGLLGEFGFDVLPQSDFAVEEADETGTTFIENAIIKARHAAKVTGLPAIADDSGLEVDALNGAPGVYSARYAGETASDRDNVAKLLEALHDTDNDGRQARFHCVLVYMRHANDPTPMVCHGVWEGQIAHAPQGENGFGYDPVFLPADQQCTAAEMPASEKKQRSHRGQALNALFQALKASQ